MLSRCRKLLRYIKLLGTVEGVRWFAIRVGNHYNLLLRTTIVEKAPGILHPVAMRVGGSSDPIVFDQIFIDADLADLTSRVRAPRVIVDFGANVGYSSILFLNAFPMPLCWLSNLIRKTLRFVNETWLLTGIGLTLVKAAIWDSPGRLMLSRGTFRDGKE